MNWVLDALYKVMMATAVLGLVLVVSVVSWQVFSRYVTNASASWAPEVAQLAFVWTALFAIAIGVRQRRHMVMDAFTSVKNRGVNVVLNTVAAAAIVAVSAILAWYGFDSLSVSYRRVFPALGIATGWMHLAVPVSFGACVVFGIEGWVRTVFGRETKDGLLERMEAVSGLDLTDPKNEEAR
ncbi:TRAP transporter small permease [Tessaracoccus oleiagri]|uniref:TRAP transporter small permease n=1 Tax=Tessaracoccus oleiagri TaxID=686624 RepID=UPI00159F825B|nr:TRAP transporter small permease subunit [Tessaracoccus oleiagri]